MSTAAVTLNSTAGSLCVDYSAASPSSNPRIAFAQWRKYFMPASVTWSLRVVRCMSFSSSRFSSAAILALTVVLGMLNKRAASEKLPASTTFTKTGLASRLFTLSRIMHSLSRLCHLVDDARRPYTASSTTEEAWNLRNQPYEHDACLLCFPRRRAVAVRREHEADVCQDRT